MLRLNMKSNDPLKEMAESYEDQLKLALGGDDGGSSGGTQQVIQNTTPWKDQARFLSSGGGPAGGQGLFQLASQAFRRTPKQAYSGPLTAGPTGEQNQALEQQEQIAQNRQGLGQEVIDLGQAQARGDFLTPESNPFLQDSVNAALRPIQQRFDTEVIPQLSSAAKSGGAFGSSQHDKFKALATEQLGKVQSETAAKIYLDNFARERQLQQNAPGLIGQGFGLETAPTDLLFNVGAQKRAFNQDKANDSITRFGLKQAAPFTGLPEYAAILQGGFPGSSTVSSSTIPGPSTAQRVGSGAIGGGALGGLAANQLLGTTGVGPLAPFIGGGAVLGGLLGGL